MLLTGDQPGAAKVVGALLGIEPADIFSGVRPAGKKDKIVELQQGGCVVAMVGDGVNDTAALAQVGGGGALHSRASAER